MKYFRRRQPSHHYQMHKELARSIITERLTYWNRYYEFEIGRVSIRNQKRRWGSCSEHGNLNFNYKLIFLPETLMNYVIVHELCHIKELHHGEHFWNEVQKTLPDYRERKAHLGRITSVPARGFPSSVVQTSK